MALPQAGFPLAEERIYDVLSSALPGNFYLRRERSGFIGLRFTLVYNVLTPADRATLISEWDTAKGRGGTLSFTHPTEGGLTVRFADSELAIQRVSATAYRAEVGIEIEGP